jgi:hypothetical protein
VTRLSPGRYRPLRYRLLRYRLLRYRLLRYRLLRYRPLSIIATKFQNYSVSAAGQPIARSLSALYLNCGYSHY